MNSNWIDEILNSLSDNDLLRTLRQIDSAPGSHIDISGKNIVNFASNNYLGLADHPLIKDAVKSAVDEWGFGSGASQLVSGYTKIHDNLCKKLAEFESTDSAVLFPTGFQANLGVIGALAGKGDLIIIDKLSHASIIDGAKLSSAKLRTYAHNDMYKLEKMLKASEGKKTLVATDSVFSMDGDLAPLDEIYELCRKYNAMMLVDEAHASGVLGKKGSGALEHFNLKNKGIFVVGTLSKALGGLGGFAAGSKSFCDLLINKARPAIYTTALPPASAACALTALELVESESWRREKLMDNAKLLHTQLRDKGFDVPATYSMIIPIIIGDADKTMRISKQLFEKGFLVPAIRPPTVAPSTSRLRISLMATHTNEDIESLVDELTHIF